jgi:hypothetical protein
MPHSEDLESNLTRADVEPLLPIEKKLIGWSLGIGVLSLIGLLILNWLVPLF